MPKLDVLASEDSSSGSACKLNAMDAPDELDFDGLMRIAALIAVLTSQRPGERVAGHAGPT
jgi:hypothetical protein